MATRAVSVIGLRELEAAFAVYDRRLSRGLKEVLEAAAEPVRQDAQSLAIQRIPKVTLPWSRMRTGVRSSVAFIAPEKRGRKGTLGRRYSRPNFKGLLLERAMEPALEQNRDDVEREFEEALADYARVWSRV